MNLASFKYGVLLPFHSAVFVRIWILDAHLASYDFQTFFDFRLHHLHEFQNRTVSLIFAGNGLCSSRDMG